METFIFSEDTLNVDHFNELHIHRCSFVKENFHIRLFEDLNIEFVESLTNAVDKRKSEYLAGRYCAKQALTKLNIYDFNILTGHHRAPIWPKAVVGSITHTKGFALSAVAHCENYTYLGIDYEECLTQKTAAEVQSSIISPLEFNLLNNSGLGFEEALTLTFSGKESLFKALYPHVGQYFDFRDAGIVDISTQSQTFELTLLKSLNNQIIKGISFKGWFEISNNHVITIIAKH